MHIVDMLWKEQYLKLKKRSEMPGDGFTSTGNLQTTPCKTSSLGSEYGNRLCRILLNNASELIVADKKVHTSISCIWINF